MRSQKYPHEIYMVFVWVSSVKLGILVSDGTISTVPFFRGIIQRHKPVQYIRIEHSLPKRACKTGALFLVWCIINVPI